MLQCQEYAAWRKLERIRFEHFALISHDGNGSKGHCDPGNGAIIVRPQLCEASFGLRH